jgi:hypothetical protein
VTVVEQPIEQAPDWVRQLISPPAEVARMRALVRRYLAGDRSVEVGPWSELEARLDADDRASTV